MYFIFILCRPLAFFAIYVNAPLVQERHLGGGNDFYKPNIKFCNSRYVSKRNLINKRPAANGYHRGGRIAPSY